MNPILARTLFIAGVIAFHIGAIGDFHYDLTVAMAGLLAVLIGSCEIAHQSAG